jgi:hypothetical protein
VTNTGHVPFGVDVPTVQLQLTIPKSSAVFVTRPESVLGILLYVTVIVQVESGFVCTVTAALSPRETGDVNVCTETLSAVVADGFLGVIVVGTTGVGTSKD